MTEKKRFYIWIAGIIITLILNQFMLTIPAAIMCVLTTAWGIHIVRRKRYKSLNNEWIDDILRKHRELER